MRTTTPSYSCVKLKTLLFLFLVCVSIQVVAQYPDDGKPLWACRDTTIYTATGYIAILGGIIPSTFYSKSSSIYISGGLPIKHSDFGFAGKIGYGNTPVYSLSQFLEGYYALTGVFASFQLSSKYSFDLRVLAGAEYCESPEYTYNSQSSHSTYNGNISDDSTIYNTVTEAPKNTLTFLFQAGIGFKYMIAYNSGILINVDYSKRSHFNNTQYATTTGSGTSIYNSTTGMTNYNYYPISNPTTITSVLKNNTNEEIPVISIGLYYQIGSAVLKK